MTATASNVRVHRDWSQWLVIALVIVALAAGWGVKAYAEGLSVRYSGAGVSVLYPAGWVASATEDMLRFRDARSGALPPVLEVHSYPAGAGGEAAALLGIQADALALNRARELPEYRTLEANAITLQGQPALQVSYAFVKDPPNPAYAGLPTVMVGEDLLMLREGRVYVFTLQAPQEQFSRLRSRLQAMINSARFGAQ